MEKPKDYYGILGVPRDASAAAIRRAYRRLAHDRRPGAAPGVSVEDFRALQAAYATLADAETRRRYDQALREQERGRFDSLAWSFVRRPAAGDLRRPVSPGCWSGEIVLSAAEAARGGPLPLHVPVSCACPTCDGTGGFVFDCPRCEGGGTVLRRVPVPLQLPRGVRDGAVFQVAVSEPGVRSVLLTVHVGKA